jgi:hypothetical protein
LHITGADPLLAAALARRAGGPVQLVAATARLAVLFVRDGIEAFEWIGFRPL